MIYHAANKLLMQQSDGSFVAAAGFPGGSALTRSVALADMNGDGRLDVLVVNYNSASELLLQQSDGSFVAAADYFPGDTRAQSVALGDVDGDGRLDVLLGSGTGNGNQLLILSPCPDGGAQSHANSACFACLPRTHSAVSRAKWENIALQALRSAFAARWLTARHLAVVRGTKTTACARRGTF